jgi:hypothetical protein
MSVMDIETVVPPVLQWSNSMVGPEKTPYSPFCIEEDTSA